MIRDEKKRDGGAVGLSADIYHVPATLQRLGYGGSVSQTSASEDRSGSVLQESFSWVKRIIGRDRANAGGGEGRGMKKDKPAQNNMTPPGPGEKAVGGRDAADHKRAADERPQQ